MEKEGYRFLQVCCQIKLDHGLELLLCASLPLQIAFNEAFERCSTALAQATATKNMELGRNQERNSQQNSSPVQLMAGLRMMSQESMSNVNYGGGNLQGGHLSLVTETVADASQGAVQNVDGTAAQAVVQNVDGTAAQLDLQTVANVSSVAHGPNGTTDTTARPAKTKASMIDGVVLANIPEELRPLIWFPNVVEGEKGLRYHDDDLNGEGRVIQTAKNSIYLAVQNDFGVSKVGVSKNDKEGVFVRYKSNLAMVHYLGLFLIKNGGCSCLIVWRCR